MLKEDVVNCCEAYNTYSNLNRKIYKKMGNIIEKICIKFNLKCVLVDDRQVSEKYVWNGRNNCSISDDYVIWGCETLGDMGAYDDDCNANKFIDFQFVGNLNKKELNELKNIINADFFKEVKDESGFYSYYNFAISDDIIKGED